MPMRGALRVGRALHGVAVAAGALVTYGVWVVPVTRRELHRWERVASAIPDPDLRRMALDTLADERMNAEAASVFGIISPRRLRRAAVRVLVAIQVLVDYVDTLSEQPAEAPLDASLLLHSSIGDAVGATARGASSDYYAGYSVGDDGGYLTTLMATCRRELQALPSYAQVQAVTEAAAARCGAGQSHTHAARVGDAPTFSEWAATLDRRDGFSWWEAAAGASSSVSIHALIAAAADPATTEADARLLDTAYYPPIGTLTVLFDSLIDREDDRRTGNHNYMAYYADGGEAAGRLGTITRAAQAAVRPLRRRRRHEAIVAGVAGFYLGASDDVAWIAAVRAHVLPELGAVVPPIMALMRVRRRLSDRARRRERPAPVR